MAERFGVIGICVSTIRYIISISLCDFLFTGDWRLSQVRATLAYMWGGGFLFSSFFFSELASVEKFRVGFWLWCLSRFRNYSIFTTEMKTGSFRRVMARDA